MLSPNRIFDLEVDKMKGFRISAAFCPLILFYVFILVIGSYGPQKMVTDTITNVYCEDDLHFVEESEQSQPNNVPENSENYKCIVCKDIYPFGKNKISNLRLEISTSNEYLSEFEELETNFNISLFESKHMSLSCQNLTHLTSKASFPEVDLEKVGKSKKRFKEEAFWDLVVNNGLLEGAPICEQSSNPNEKSKCITDIYGNIDIKETSSNVALMLSFPLSKEQKEKIEDIKFYMIFKNSVFSSFESSFEIGIILVSLLTLAYVALKLAPLSPKDWLPVQKWALTLILTQTFLDNIPSVLSEGFESETLSTISEFGENIHIALVLYFMASVYDQILAQNMRDSIFCEWADKIKVTIIGYLVVLNLSYNLYVGIETLEHDYKDLLTLRLLLDCIEFLITLLQVFYGLLFAIIAILCIRLTAEGKLSVDKAWKVLFILTGTTFLMTVLSLGILYFFEEEGFSSSAIHGFTGIYILTVGIIYSPHSLKTEKTTEGDITKEGDKMHNVDQSELSQEDDKVQEKSSEDNAEKKQQMVWEVINQDEEETPQPEKPVKQDSDNDEYIYL